MHTLKTEDEKTFLVICYGNLFSCAPNPFHKEEVCKTCNHISKHAIANLIPKDVEIINLKIHRFSSSKFKFLNYKMFLNLKYEVFPIGRLVLSQISDELDSYNLEKLNTKFKKRAELMAGNGVELYNAFKTYIQKFGITRVFSWNGRRPSDGAPIYAALRLGVEYFCFISGGETGKIFVTKSLSVQDITNTTKLIHDFKKNNSIAKITKNGYRYLKQYKKGTLNQVGYIKFSGKKSIKIQKNSRKKVLVVTSSPQEFIHQPDITRFYKNNFINTILKFVNSQKIYKKFEIIIRWHPRIANSKTGDIKKVTKAVDQTPFLTHILPDSDISTEKLLKNVDIVISFGSTVGYQAVIEGKPLIVCGPLHQFSGNSCYKANSQKELLEILNKKIRPKPPLDVLATACYMQSFGRKMKFIKYISANESIRWFLHKENTLTPIHPINKIKSDNKIKYLIQKIQRILLKILLMFKKANNKKIYKTI